MIVVNKVNNGNKTYIISIGAEHYRVYAQSEEQAIEFVAERLNPNWYFSSLSVELMAQSVNKSVEEFINATDLRHCPKYNIYLPKLKIEEIHR